MAATINLNRKLRPGQCGVTKRGVRYCRTARGVRFVGRKR